MGTPLGTAGNNIGFGLNPNGNGYGDYIENAGLVRGGQISFLIDCPSFYDFAGAKVNITGKDDWVMDNMTVSYLDTYKRRRAYLVETSQGSTTSHFWVQREAITAKIFDLKASIVNVVDENGISNVIMRGDDLIYDARKKKE